MNRYAFTRLKRAEWYLRLLWRGWFSCVSADQRTEAIWIFGSRISAFVMTSPTHCSPSRSSLSCCQFDRISQDDVRDPTIISNNNYFLQQEKHSFPKRPELDLSFCDIRYRVRDWNLRRFSVSKYQETIAVMTYIM